MGSHHLLTGEMRGKLRVAVMVRCSLNSARSRGSVRSRGFSGAADTGLKVHFHLVPRKRREQSQGSSVQVCEQSQGAKERSMVI